MSTVNIVDRTCLPFQWQELAFEVNGHLEKVLDPSQGFPSNLLQAMRHGVLGPGKRLRPVLVVLASRVFHAKANPWPAASAVELVHAYSLIHDDLPAMDDDDLRRGRPTCHKLFGEAMAILAGDALLTLAFETLAKNYPSSISAPCCLELARGIGGAGMVGGQVQDLMWEGKIPSESPLGESLPGEQELERLHSRKTGALFQACLRMGYHVSQGQKTENSREDLLDLLDQYGQNIGLAFQVTDDLLDVEGNCQATGKRVGKDARKGKLTYPGLLGTERSKHLAGELCSRAKEIATQFGPGGLPFVELADFLATRDH